MKEVLRLDPEVAKGYLSWSRSCVRATKKALVCKVKTTQSAIL